MNVKKEFAPITITLDTEKDKYVFLDILEAAYRKRTEGLLWREGIPREDGVVNTIKYLQERVK